jgi:O-antigen/teichoic acid export membrane protein
MWWRIFLALILLGVCTGLAFLIVLYIPLSMINPDVGIKMVTIVLVLMFLALVASVIKLLSDAFKK